MMAGLLAGISFREHDNAQREREQAARHNRNISLLQDSIRDMVLISDRPLVIYHAGSEVHGDETMISWPPAAEALLGWTLEDVQDCGLEIMIPEEYKIRHSMKMEEFVAQPPGRRKTAVLNVDAVHKDGGYVPVRLTAWVVGNKTRSIAAHIEPQSQVVEQRLPTVANQE